MRARRTFLLAASAAAWVPAWAIAQRRDTLRIGYLAADRASNSPFFVAFVNGMRTLGYVEGRNLVIEARFGEGSLEAMDRLAAEMVALKPQIIVTQGGPATFPMQRAVQRAGATMPVVFGYSGDPVAAKLVASFARPGGNFTGMSFLSLDLVSKRMGMLKEILPGLQRVGIVANPGHPGQPEELNASQAAARSLGLAINYYRTRDEAELESAFAAIPKAREEALDVFPDAFTVRQAEKIAAFATAKRVPAISGWARFAEAGNLMSYGPDLRDIFRRLASYVDKIARGAKPAELPVELPTSVELVVNLKAARAMGIAIPTAVLARASQIIE